MTGGKLISYYVAGPSGCCKHDYIADRWLTTCCCRPASPRISQHQLERLLQTLPRSPSFRLQEAGGGMPVPYHPGSSSTRPASAAALSGCNRLAAARIIRTASTSKLVPHPTGAVLSPLRPSSQGAVPHPTGAILSPLRPSIQGSVPYPTGAILSPLRPSRQGVVARETAGATEGDSGSLPTLRLTEAGAAAPELPQGKEAKDDSRSLPTLRFIGMGAVSPGTLHSKDLLHLGRLGVDSSTCSSTDSLTISCSKGTADSHSLSPSQPGPDFLLGPGSTQSQDQGPSSAQSQDQGPSSAQSQDQRPSSAQSQDAAARAGVQVSSRNSRRVMWKADM